MFIADGVAKRTGGFLDRILGSLATVKEMADAAQPNMPTQHLQALMQFTHNENLLAALGHTKEVRLLVNMHCSCRVTMREMLS